MTISNADRVGKAIELLRDGLFPFIKREMQATYGKEWDTRAAKILEERALLRGANPDLPSGSLDFQAMVTLLLQQWEEVFRRTLGQFERTLVHEMNTTRNRWAHQETFTTDDTYRALDSAGRLLTSVGAATQADEIEKEKQELLRVRFDEQARREKAKAVSAPPPVAPGVESTLPPWRSVATPHADVATGRYLTAEFAADLAQVARGEGADEYRDPEEFFGRTFLTDGLRLVLQQGLKRLTMQGGEPVMELQTNFGGGKTHTMLGLYHLFSGTPASRLPGLESLLADAKVEQPPKANRAVLVGTWLSPSQPRTKAGGLVVHTLWGELAWQLGGGEAYELVRADDEAGTSPGTDTLRELFDLHSPCLVLIDEWVAYARQVYGIDGLPGGSFDANTHNFAQSLSEAARAAKQTFIVVSVPESNIELGGEGGQRAVEVLRNTIGRVAMPWRPASRDESFEIVRRRLFEPLGTRDAATRDGVVKAFADYYAKNADLLPQGCRDFAYQERMKAAYPIHPELFERLYDDWSTLDRFQRTRGVLRLMAAVIHTLWERNDPAPIILPSSIPIDEANVQFELTRHLEEPWVPVIDKDVDGAGSLPIEIDRETPQFGRYAACRRVARSIFMGSAPTLKTNRRGIADRNIVLGSALPGESVSTFGNALRKLSDEATHLYVDNSRYWFDTQPSVSRTAKERAASLEIDDVREEIRHRLREQRKAKGEFGLEPIICPSSTSDVLDEQEARLVVLGPERSHSAAESTALEFAKDILEHRGTSARTNRNALVFVAADKSRLATLEQTVRQFLAWKSIDDQAEELNLDAFQRGQARSKRTAADEAISQQIPDAFSYVLVPSQQLGSIEIEWSVTRLPTSTDSVAVRASKRLTGDEALFTTMGGGRLRLELDRVPLWRGNDVPVRQLLTDFATYLYLPRLKDHSVLEMAVVDGVRNMTWRTETFAIAESYDENKGRYLGLKAAQAGMPMLDGSTLVVKPDIAGAQVERDAAAAATATTEPGQGAHAAGGGQSSPAGPSPTSSVTPEPRQALKTRFFATTELNPLKVAGGAQDVANEVVRHLIAQPFAKVRVRLEIEAEAPDGYNDALMRDIMENAATLKFTAADFEEG